MAVSLTQSSSPSLWTNSNIAIAVCKGLHLNRGWENVIKHNNDDQRKLPEGKAAVALAVMMTAGLFEAFSRIERVVSSTQLHQLGNVIPDPSGVFFYGALTIAALNATALFKEHLNKSVADVESTIDKFIIVVWKATPYLMVITNIALTIYEIRDGKTVNVIQLGMSAITLLDITQFVPQSYSWYLDVGIRIPIDAAALYYEKPSSSMMILAGWATSSPIKETAKELWNKLA